VVIIVDAMCAGRIVPWRVDEAQLRDQMFNVTSMKDSDGLHVDECIDYTEWRHRRCGPNASRSIVI
jgi:hypothetical protein